MDGVLLQDRLARGMGAAARVMGEAYDLMRPRGAVDPVLAERRVLRLSAVFDGGDPGYRRARGYERALRGMFDTAYVAVGDYLVGSRGVLFVAALPPLARPLCVLTNATLEALRPMGPGVAGLNPYGGVGTLGFEAVFSGWPGQVMASSGQGGMLPGDGVLADHSVLLPVGVPLLRRSDVLVDGLGRRFVVGAVEQSELGFRVSARLGGV